jgi:tetratricopeptide (TPR) repeat protein
MRAFGWTALLLLAGGCTSPMEQRVREYNDDGLFLYRRGDYREARDTFQAALEMSPEDISLRFNLAQACEQLGDRGKAEKLYQECLTRDANHADSRFALCALLVQQGRREDASRMVEDWLAREPKRGDAYALDGWLWHQAGDLPRAQSRLQQAVQMDPGNVRALTELGLVYESYRRPDRALALYERSLERDPDQPGVIVRVNRLKSQGVSSPQPD